MHGQIKVLSGKGMDYIPDTLYWHLEGNQFKSICLELQTDDNIEFDGISFNINVIYDICEWEPIQECYTKHYDGKYWMPRGPFWDGDWYEILYNSVYNLYICMCFCNI